MTPTGDRSTLRRLAGTRRLQLLAIVAAGACAAIAIGLKPGDLMLSHGGWQLVKRFLAAAFVPALDYEVESLPAGTPSFLTTLALAGWRTVAFAAAAISIALPAGIVLGVLASTRLQCEALPFGRLANGFICWTVRILTALARSIHELLWAVLFLAAVGLSNFAAVLAIAIPYSGVLAKVFSEMIDEASRGPADTLKASGATGLQTFAFGILPQALPDMLAYTCYRFECALRSSVVLGFFGIPTLGYHLHLAFAESHYRETWSCLYALAALVVFVDWWSGAMRRRLVG